MWTVWLSSSGEGGERATKVLNYKLLRQEYAWQYLNITANYNLRSSSLQHSQSHLSAVSVIKFNQYSTNCIFDIWQLIMYYTLYYCQWLTIDYNLNWPHLDVSDLIGSSPREGGEGRVTRDIGVCDPHLTYTYPSCWWGWHFTVSRVYLL